MKNYLYHRKLGYKFENESSAVLYVWGKERPVIALGGFPTNNLDKHTWVRKVLLTYKKCKETTKMNNLHKFLYGQRQAVVAKL